MYYDLIVLGGGPGGYLAAERAGQAGLKTLCIEDRHMGGTCLNEGCIPTKTLLHSAKLYDHALDSAAYGVTAESVRVDHAAVIARKERVIKTLVGGVRAAMKASGVTTVNGRAVITGKDPAGYSVKANGDRYVGKNLIIATGAAGIPEQRVRRHQPVTALFLRSTETAGGGRRRRHRFGDGLLLPDDRNRGHGCGDDGPYCRALRQRSGKVAAEKL